VLDASGSKLDSSESNVKVTGSGKLDVNVNAPPGTSVRASGDGLLKDTKVQQETQMAPASKGADAGMALD
jgi:hypothetical protein